MKHFLIVTVLVVVLTAVVGLGLNSIGLLPDQASLQAIYIDELFNVHIWAISFLFALIVGFMIYSIVVFRRKPGEEGEGDHFEGNTRLEIFWTIIPLGIVLYFAYLGSVSLADIQRKDPNANNITVVGSQWSWRFDYDDYGFSSADLVLPVNEQVLLTLISNDVIHSFWVPEFRVKQDALPGEGMERELRVSPNEIGSYKLRCAELCGREHAYMNADVIIMEPEDFKAWVADQLASVSDDPAVRGETWYQQFGCLACHSLDGSTRAGPTWQGIYGTEEALSDGTVITVDDDYLYQAIIDPQFQVVEGYENVVMPPTGENMSEQQIQDVIEFIKSLGE